MFCVLICMIMTNTGVCKSIIYVYHRNAIIFIDMSCLYLAKNVGDLIRVCYCVAV